MYTNDDTHTDIKVTEEHIHQGDYHFILENSEAIDTPNNVQAELGPPPLAPPFDQWLSSRKSHSDIMMAFKSWSEPSTIICNLCLQECDRGKPFQNHLEEVHRVCNKSKNLFEEKQHKCALCHEIVRQYLFNLENHYKERHGLTVLEYYQKYVAGLKQFDFPPEDEVEDEDNDSEFIEAM